MASRCLIRRLPRRGTDEQSSGCQMALNPSENPGEVYRAQSSQIEKCTNFSFGLDNLDYCRSTSMTIEANRGRTRLVEITLVYTLLQARYTSYTSASGEWRATREWDGRTAYNRGEAKRREGEGKGTYMSQYGLGRRKSGHKGVGERRKTHQYIAGVLRYPL
ncbi:hypothetical protein B0H19DRAFT_1066112 [Mycena capillaripes]|nr:hypothetical protein B0H19DRAFT_1066112 [Mycena capillaripes]